MPFRFRFALVLVFFWIALLPRPEATAQRLQSGDAVLVQEKLASYVELASGRRFELGLYPGLSASSFNRVRGGWMVAASWTRERTAEVVLFSISAGGEIETWASLPPSRARLRREPQLLIRNGDLEGLAWLEGEAEDALMVRVAAWNSSTWGPAQTVSPPAPGSQLALTSATLKDGTWLLAWSAFDGEDDEILWSERRRETWSPPRRVGPDNGVPDITPSLLALGNGALLAWSLYDGNDYRLRLVRLKEGQWRDVSLRVEPGSLEPTLLATTEDDPTRGRLLYQTVRPPGWTVLELDTRGHVRRRASLSLPHAQRALWSQRPVVATGDSHRVLLRWPGLRQRVTVQWDTMP